MLTVAIALGSFVLYIVAYRTYGRYLARRIFRVEPEREPPSIAQSDGIDFVPSRKELVFGHHFTSIAGTGPIVGPAVALVWGWIPALIWVLVGSIVMGAVHDFGSLIISMRHQGRTIADLSSDVISARVRVLFLVVVAVGLWIVLAVFGLVIAAVFAIYPSSVVPVFLQIPIAIGLGIWLRRGGSLLLGTAIAVLLMYGTIAWSGSIGWATAGNPEGVAILPAGLTEVVSPFAFWTIILLGYVFVASVLPVQTLLQPRDFINSWQLLIAMGLLLIGLLASRPPIVADAINFEPVPAVEGGHVPAFMPFLFVTIACGAISGFHCLVSSGSSSRQLRSEADAQYVGYGAMLTEGFLATLVIVACAAGIGLGTVGVGGDAVVGREAWMHHYAVWGGDAGLGQKLAPFITGSANMISTIGISPELAVAIMGVFVASFAATTLDSATRLQRYVISELGGGGRTDHNQPALRLGSILGNRFAATTIAVVTAGALALSDAFTKGWAGAGAGGLVLWPLFGATNQLIGGLALLVITVWLGRLQRPVWVTAIPMVFMLVMTGWAIASMITGFAGPVLDGADNGRPHLLVLSALMLALEIWIVGEGLLLLARLGKQSMPEATPGLR